MDEAECPRSGFTRRGLLAAGVGVTGALAGCLGGSESTNDRPESAVEPPDPVDLSGGKRDDRGGMVIGDHFGPNGQVFYRDNSPDGHDNPAWFHTLADGLFPYHFERERRGWSAVAIYVTDYSRADYELLTHDDRTFITSHTDAGTFAPAANVEFVAGSNVLGGMGRDLLPFSDAADAEAFAAEHEGRLVAFADLDAEFLNTYD